MVPKPNYRMRKVRKTGLTTIELQRRFPDLYEATTKAQDEGTAPSTCSAVKNSGSVTIVPSVSFLTLGSTVITHCLYHVSFLSLGLTPITHCLYHVSFLSLGSAPITHCLYHVSFLSLGSAPITHCLYYVSFLSLVSCPTTHCLYHLCHFCLRFNSRYCINSGQQSVNSTCNVNSQ